MPAELSQAVRFHLSLNVTNLNQSIQFFRALFGTDPAKQRADYAKFEINDPPLVLSLEPHAPAGRGALNHAGFRFPSSAALVDAQRRLELAGFQTQREEGVECCYSRQTKFWVNDPDGGLWEFYVLEGDLEHRGAGQASDKMLPQLARCDSKAGQPLESSAVYEHRMGSTLSLLPQAEDSLAEIRLRGTFNLPDLASQMPEVLAQSWRALRPGGRLHVHVLTTDRPLTTEALSLPGPAACVKHVPVDRELLSALEVADFANLTLTTFRPAACFRIGDAELRETMVVCEKPLSELNGEVRVVVYKGPFAQVNDDRNRTFHRGQRVTISLAAWESLQRSPLGDQFVCLEAHAGTQAVCGTH
jgi:catechol 2,3-dioxygenase-like lactoylglutathione lyase family enzyme